MTESPGARSGGLGRVSENCTCVNIPGSNWYLLFTTSISTGRVREIASRELAVRVTVPGNGRSPKAETKTEACEPTCTAPAESWGTLTRMRRRSICAIRYNPPLLPIPGVEGEDGGIEDPVELCDEPFAPAV